MHTLYGFAADMDRVRQWGRILGLTRPLKELSSDTLQPGHNPATGQNWTVAEIKADPEWIARGNTGEDGTTNGYTFTKLREAEPLSEDNFILTDVPSRDYELVAKWLRSKLPDNAGTSVRGEDWDIRRGMLVDIIDPGEVPDSDPDANGNFPVVNKHFWITVNLFAPFPFDQWGGQYASFVAATLDANHKVSNRGNSDTPIYVLESSPGVLAMGLIDWNHQVRWRRRTR